MSMAGTVSRRPGRGMPGLKLSAPQSLNSLLLITGILLLGGLLMMTSASIEIASSQFGDPFYHLKRQAIFAVIGLLVAIITLHVPIKTWRSYSSVSYTHLTLPTKA